MASYLETGVFTPGRRFCPCRPASDHSDRCAVNTRAGSGLGCSEWKLARCLQKREEPANIAPDLYLTCGLVSSLIGSTAHLLPSLVIPHALNLKGRRQLNEAYVAQSVSERGGSECVPFLCLIPGIECCWPTFSDTLNVTGEIGACLLAGQERCLFHW